jgi:hypothetical protein
MNNQLTNIEPNQTTVSLLYVIELVLKDNQHIFDLEKSTYLLQDVIDTNYVKIHVKEYDVDDLQQVYDIGITKNYYIKFNGFKHPRQSTRLMRNNQRLKEILSDIYNIIFENQH